MHWQKTDELPGMLVRTRQFVSNARWWCITISNGFDGDDAREWEFIEAGTSEAEAISKAAASLRQLAR